MSKSVKRVTIHGHGCFGFVVFCAVLWALCFGVTVGGVHYGTRCSEARGVEVYP